MTDDPDFYAWLDGELSEPQASAMAARVAADPELASFAQQHRALPGRLTAAFAPVAAAPIPERLRAAAAPKPAEVVGLAAARERRRRWSVTGLAVAASLALGFTIGGVLPRDGGSFRSEGDQLAAAGPLDQALDTQLASVGDQAGIRIGLSFRDQSGRYCRTFTADVQSGLACRSGEGWSIEGLVRSEQQSLDYRMAAGVDPALGALIDSRVAGEPLNRTAEAKLVRDDWRD
jgi:hypothetical protein